MRMIYLQIKLRVLWVLIGLMIAVYSIFSPTYVINTMIDRMKKAGLV